MTTLKKAGFATAGSLILTVLHILFTQLAYFTAYPDESEMLVAYNTFRHIIVSALIFISFYYSFVRVKTVYNTPLREKYLNAEGNIGMFSLFFSSFDFWTDIIVFSAVSLIGYGKAFSFVFDLFGEGGRLASLAVTLPVIALIAFLARFNATKIWNRTLENPESEELAQKEDNIGKKGHKPIKLMPTAPTFAAMRFIANNNSDSNPALENEQAAPFNYGISGMIKSYSLVLAIFVLCSMLGRLVYSLISLLLVPIFMISYAKYAATILFTVLVALPIIRLIKKLSRRASLISKTKKICRERKYKLTEIKAPFASIFSSIHGESFRITVDGKTFSCKFVSAKKPTLPIILREDGTGDILHSLTFLGIKWFERRKPFRFGYESINKQILIINPSAKFVCSENNGTLSELDNGDSVGNYIIYTAGGFVNALDREVLGVNDKEKYKYKYI